SRRHGRGTARCCSTGWSASCPDRPRVPSPLQCDPMTQTVGVQPQQGLSELLGLGLLRTAWRLLTAHWWQLLAIATCAYVLHHYLIQAAVRVGRAGAVPGLLVFSLVPLVPLVATVLMLLVLRERHQSSGGLASFIAAIGSVLIPFLVVY